MSMKKNAIFFRRGLLIPKKSNIRKALKLIFQDLSKFKPVLDPFLASVGFSGVSTTKPLTDSNFSAVS